jgi:hypothetical protein
MRRGQVLLLGLLTGWVLGCATGEPVRSVSWFERFRAAHGPTGPDVIQMEVALLERPPGDAFINQELWTLADEQTVPLDRKAALEDNGFRVGQIGGIPPARLQALLTSERSCANPRRIKLHAGCATTLVVGPLEDRCRFELQEEDQTQAVSLEQGECILSVVPTLTKDGRTRLQFTPKVRHGESTLTALPAPDRATWMLQEQRPVESYPTVAWEVALAPNEYLVVGGRADRPQTLGHHSFVRPESPAPVQRLLVIRTRPVAADNPVEPQAGSLAEDSAFHKSPSLALQAALPGGRGRE